MMMLWNKVSLACPYLGDVRSHTNEGLVRVGSARSEVSLQIFPVGVTIGHTVGCLYLYGDFNLFFRFVRREDLVSSTLCFGHEGVQVCVAWGVAPTPSRCSFGG